MALKTLKPRLTALDVRSVKTMAAHNPIATPRTRGSVWMDKRKAALIRGGYTCVDCGHVSARLEVDHDTPLEQGGTDEDSNLKLRCAECHKVKTAREAAGRSRR